MQPPSYLDEVDKNTLSLLYQRYAQGIFTYLRLHVPSREDAEDLLVETFHMDPVSSVSWLPDSRMIASTEISNARVSHVRVWVALP